MFVMGRLGRILDLFLILTVNCQPSVNLREYPNTASAASGQFMHQDANANTPIENLDTHSTYSSSIVSDGNHISNPTNGKPSHLDSPRFHEASYGQDSSSFDHSSNVNIDETRGSNHESPIVNQKHDQSGSSHGVYTSMHKKTTHNAQQIPTVSNIPLPNMARGPQPSPGGQAHDFIYKDIGLDNRLSQGKVPGARINQPPPNYFDDELGSMVSNHGPELSERRHFHDSKDTLFKDPSDNTVSRSQWEAGDQSSSHNRPKKSRRDTSSEYQLDEIFSLPSRDDPIQNQADFVSLVVIVPPGVKHCYFYRPITNFDVEYQVLKGGHLDIGIFIRDPEGEPIAIRPPLSDSQVSISVPKYFRLMPYAICLDNRKASYAYKNVYFSVDANLNWDNPSELERQAIETLRNNPLVNSQAQAASAEHAENINKLMAQLDILFGRLRRIEHMQQRSSNFDSADKSLMEGNLERIMTGSLFQVVLMIAVATVQMGQTTEVTGNDDELWKTASEAGEKFSALYYRAFDKPNRPDLPGFFMDNVVLLWNGNRVEGQQLVVDFFSKLPDSTCTLHSLSCQPVHKSLSGDRLLVLVNVFGTIKFEQHPTHIFSETFFLTQESNLWRVQSVTFRFID
ncbi:unnamed protein product [Schistosoma bovis]|nr:unnamed protein product [Schistosoma bovis]